MGVEVVYEVGIGRCVYVVDYYVVYLFEYDEGEGFVVELGYCYVFGFWIFGWVVGIEVVVFMFGVEVDVG